MAMNDHWTFMMMMYSYKLAMNNGHARLFVLYCTFEPEIMRIRDSEPGQVRPVHSTTPGGHV